MTILFLEDWDKYPSAIVHHDTKNETFIRLASLYKSMGVKNHAFPLALINPELKHVDPFNTDITQEQMIMVAIECKQNPWYFFREISRVPGSTDRRVLRFRANRGNIALYWLFFNHIFTLLIQPRQTGKSFSTDQLFGWLLNIRCRLTNITLLTKDDKLRTANLDRLKSIDKEYPFYLRQRADSDIANTEKIVISSLENKYEGLLPNRSPKLALNVGRGMTSSIFQIDEGGYIPNIGISLPAALAAGTSARDRAREDNDPYGSILTTTAGKKDDRDGRYVYNLLCDAAIWSEKLLDAKNLQELELLIRKSSTSKNLSVNCTFNHRQLGYDDAWLKRAIEEAKSTGEDAERDFLNIWTAGSLLSPIPIPLAETLRKSQREPDFVQICDPYGYLLRWYVPEQLKQHKIRSTHLSISLDTSDASGGDDISLTARCIKTGEVVFAGNFNETNLIMFAEFILSLIIEYTNSTWIIERRSSAATIIDYLLLLLPSKDIDPFKVLFNRVVQESDEFPERFEEINKAPYLRSSDIYIKYKKYFGFATSGQGYAARSELYSSTLLSSCKVTGSKVYDKKTIDQVLGLINKNGRIDHADGEHDDSCISWLLSYWLMTKGKNLSFYGINTKEILCDNATIKEEKSPINTYKQNEQNYIRKQLEEIADKMKNERNSYLLHVYELKMRNLANKLNEEHSIKFSVDEFMESLKINRRNTFNQRFR